MFHSEQHAQCIARGGSALAFDATESRDFTFLCVSKLCLGGLVGWDEDVRCCRSSEKLNQHFPMLRAEKFLFLSCFTVYRLNQLVFEKVLLWIVKLLLLSACKYLTCIGTDCSPLTDCESSVVSVKLSCVFVLLKSGAVCFTNYWLCSFVWSHTAVNRSLHCICVSSNVC